MLRPELGLLNPDDVIFDVFDVPYRLFHCGVTAGEVDFTSALCCSSVAANAFIFGSTNLKVFGVTSIRGCTEQFLYNAYIFRIPVP